MLPSDEPVTLTPARLLFQMILGVSKPPIYVSLPSATQMPWPVLPPSTPIELDSIMLPVPET